MNTYEVGFMGNRFIIRTIKSNGFKKITPMKYRQVIKTIKNLEKQGAHITTDKTLKDYRIKAIIEKESQ